MLKSILLGLHMKRCFPWCENVPQGPYECTFLQRPGGSQDLRLVGTLGPRPSPPVIHQEGGAEGKAEAVHEK